MRKHDNFISPESVDEFLEKLEKKGILPATIHITEFNGYFTVFYKDKPNSTDL